MSVFSGRAGREKEAKRQEDIARQREETQNILNTFLSQLAPGSEEYNRLVAEGGRFVQTSESPENEQDLVRQLGQQLVTAQQDRIAGGGDATALEARTSKAFGGLREKAAFAPEEQALLDALRGLEGTGEAGTAGGPQDIFGQVVSRVRDPDAAFRSTLDPQLQQVQDQVKARAAQRGLLGSGLEIEDLGRAGVELAVREAGAREDHRQRQLENFQNLYNAGQSLRGREIGVEEALLNLQQGRESNLTGLLQSQTGNATQNLLDFLGTQTGRAENLRDTASGLREAERQAQERAIYSTLGAGASMIPGVGPALGAGFGSMAGGLPSPGGLQAATQTGQEGAAPVSQASTLSRRRKQTPDEDQFAALLSALGGGG